MQNLAVKHWWQLTAQLFQTSTLRTVLPSVAVRKEWKERSHGWNHSIPAVSMFPLIIPEFEPEWELQRPTNLQVSHKLLGGGECGELGRWSHADPSDSGAGAPPQPHDAVLSVDDPQSVAHSLTGRAATHESCTDWSLRLAAVQFHLPSYLMFVLVSNCYGRGGLTLQVCFNLQKGNNTLLHFTVTAHLEESRPRGG